MKIYQYLCLHIKMICRRFRFITLISFSDIRTRGICNVCLQKYRNNRICKKVAYFLRNLQTSRANNSRTLRFKNAKFSEQCFYQEPSIYQNFQNCIRVPLRENFISCAVLITIFLRSIFQQQGWMIYQSYHLVCQTASMADERRSNYLKVLLILNKIFRERIVALCN